MSDLEKARRLFQESGLAFPAVPDALAARLRERQRWLFSTRTLKTSPYDLDFYVREGDSAPSPYAVLAHSGHGVNSFAIQYYLVYGPLRLYLHLAWGGAYKDAAAAAARIAECFSLADELAAAALDSPRLSGDAKPVVVGSTFYGSYGTALGHQSQERGMGTTAPAEVLVEALGWPGPGQASKGA